MDASHNNPIRVAELFAGVGGFRLGLERKGFSRKIKNRKRNLNFSIIWSNQFEPKTKKQHASDVYIERFNLIEDDKQEGVYWNKERTEKHLNIDIAKVPATDVLDHDLLVGGFPCQDYSVMRAISREIRSEDGSVASGEEGIKGPKGELWWQISRILKEKLPKMVFLENVTRLLSSPAIHKGENFEIVLKDLIELGYDVEWRTVNAAHFDLPQSRNRVFILAYKNDDFSPISSNEFDFSLSWLTKEGPFGKSFPIDSVSKEENTTMPKPGEFNDKKFFLNAGIAKWNQSSNDIFIHQISPKIIPQEVPKMPLSKILQKQLTEAELNKYSIPKAEVETWRYLKGTVRNEFRIKKAFRSSVKDSDLEVYDRLMKEPKVPKRQKEWDKHRQRFLDLTEDGLAYRYNIGAMRFPDTANRTSRTIVTSEGGKGPSRTRHIVECRDAESGYRRLMPIELERLNQFPDDWTNISGISDVRRGFMMGNALVVGVVEKLAGPITDLFQQGRE